MTSLTWDLHKGNAHSYDVVTLGYNYRIDEIRSALGLAQLQKLEDNNARRRVISQRYRAELGKLEHLSLPYDPHAGVSSAHIFPVLLDNGIDRQGFIEAMHGQGIQTSIHYPPVHQFTYYRQSGNLPHLPLTEEMASREVTLPLYPSMNDEQLELVNTAVGIALNDAAH